MPYQIRIEHLPSGRSFCSPPFEDGQLDKCKEMAKQLAESEGPGSLTYANGDPAAYICLPAEVLADSVISVIKAK